MLLLLLDALLADPIMPGPCGGMIGSSSSGDALPDDAALGRGSRSSSSPLHVGLPHASSSTRAELEAELDAALDEAAEELALGPVAVPEAAFAFAFDAFGALAFAVLLLPLAAEPPRAA